MEVVLAHAVPGRIRLRLPASRTRRMQIDRLYHRLNSVPGIRQIVSNPRTGGMTVIYDRSNKRSLPGLSRALPDIDARALQRKLVTFATARATQFRPVRTLVATAKRYINSNSIDARYFVPASLFALAIRELLRTRKPIPWYNLLWYSYSVLHSLNYSADTSRSHPEMHR